MPDKKINDLTLAGGVSDTMQLETDIGGSIENKITVSQLSDKILDTDLSLTTTLANAIQTTNATIDGLAESTTTLTSPGANQFQMTNGTSDLVVSADCTIDQDLSTTSDVEFGSVEMVNQINEFSIDTTLSGDSDLAVPSEHAVKTFVENILFPISNAFSDMQEPSGFIIDDVTGEVKRDDSELTWVNGTRTFSIGPRAPATSYNIYIEGERYTVSAIKSVVITDTEGLWFFYLDNTLTLNATQTFSVEFVYSQGCVSFGYWDATNNRMLFDKVFDERHGCKMDGHTHLWLHNQVGTRYESGLALTTFDSDGTGDDASNAQFGCDAGLVYDEDLRINILSIASTVGLPILYHTATGEWRETTNSGFSVLTTGTGRLAYNPSGSGLVEVTNNNFVNCHVFATAGIDVDGTIAAITGQLEYNNVVSAREGANTEINSLILNGLPVQEFKFIGTVIFQTSNGYANAVKARTRTTDLGDEYVDFRRSNITASGSTGAIHNTFTDDDHLQYLNLNGRTPDQIIPDGTRAITQTTGDNSTKVATTAYVDNYTGPEMDTIRLGTDSATGTLSPSFSLTAGNNRFVFYACGSDNDSSVDWNGATYGGIQMRRLQGIQQRFDNNVLDFFYMLESDIIGLTGSKSIVFDFINAPSASEMFHFWGVYGNVNQTVPFKTAHGDEDDSVNIIDIDVLNCSVGDHVIGIGTNENQNSTLFVSSPFTIRETQEASTHEGALADAVATSSTTNLEYYNSPTTSDGMAVIGVGLIGFGKTL